MAVQGRGYARCESRCGASDGDIDLSVRHLDLDTVVRLYRHPHPAALAQLSERARQLGQTNSHLANAGTEAAEGKLHAPDHPLLLFCREPEARTRHVDPQRPGHRNRFISLLLPSSRLFPI